MPTESLKNDIVAGERGIAAGNGKLERKVLLDDNDVERSPWSVLGAVADVYRSLKRWCASSIQPIEGDLFSINAITAFYEQCGLRPEELESKEHLVREFQKKSGPVVTCGDACIDYRGNILSAVHATHDKEAKNAFIKFQATHPSVQKSGLSQKLLLHVLQRMGCLQAIGTEAVEKSESYWNRVSFRHDGIGLRRVYAQLDEKVLKEIEYHMPALQYDLNTGDDKHSGPVPEHLQVLLRNSSLPRFPVSARHHVENLIGRMSDVWYVLDPQCPPEGMTPAAVERRNAIVMEVRQGVFRSLPKEVSTLIFLSRDVRKFLVEEKGYEVHSHHVPVTDPVTPQQSTGTPPSHHFE